MSVEVKTFSDVANAVLALFTVVLAVANFFALHNALERGDPINADIDNAKGK